MLVRREGCIELFLLQVQGGSGAKPCLSVLLVQNVTGIEPCPEMPLVIGPS
jgi:hypothetical protein